MSIFYGTCILCGLSSGRTSDICQECESELPWIANACYCCGQDLDSFDNICGCCLQKRPAFDRTIALFHYQKPIDNFITALKFANKLIYAKILGELLASKLISHYSESQRWPEVIIPVPLHNKRLRERGFNQSLEITRPIAKKLKIPTDFKSCYRTRNTQAQAQISFKERQKNLINAFAVKHNFRANHIAIVDDVMTTGSTVGELSETLRQHGVQIIDIWCCARTLL
jgi:ComF family protein